MPGWMASMVLGTLALTAPPGDANPGAPDLLHRMSGVWDATLQIASPGDDPPLVINGTEVSALGGGGTWLVSDFKSQLDRRPFQGHGVLARDPRTGRYRRVWADATSPAFWSSEGAYDAASDSLTLWIETTDSAGQPVRWREVITWKDADTRTFTMYVPGPETREAAGIAIVYRRRRDGGGGGQDGGPPLAAAPGPEQSVVARGSGAWKASIDNRIDPGRTRGASKATETGTLCCGGLFLVTDLASAERGLPFSGHGLLGYDPGTRKFIRAWIDTFDRVLSLAEGQYDAGSDSLTFMVSQPDGKGGAVVRREVVQWKGPDQRLRTLYVAEAGGQESPGRTIKYRRSKE